MPVLHWARMGFVIGSPRVGLYPSRYTPISAIEVSFLPPGKLSFIPCPRMRCTCGRCAQLFSWYLFLHRRLSALHGGDVSG